MTVSEVKELIPLADVCELNTDTRYLVRVPRNIPMNVLDQFVKQLQADGIKTAVVIGEDVKFYELK